MAATDNGVKCDCCGRFFRWREPGSSWAFIPDSHMSYEESVDRCASCTEKHGRPKPHQPGVEGKAYGVCP